MLLCISGSLRRGSHNTQLAQEAARIYGGPLEMGNLRLPLYDGDQEAADGVPESASGLAAQIKAAEAVVIASPEYNQSFSGVLKNALDWVSREKDPVWRDKPVAITSATAGRAGGARGTYALRLAMTPFRAHVLPGPEVLVAACGRAFDADGRLTEESYTKALTELMDQLRAAAERLR